MFSFCAIILFCVALCTSAPPFDSNEIQNGFDLNEMISFGKADKMYRHFIKSPPPIRKIITAADWMDRHEITMVFPEGIVIDKCREEMIVSNGTFKCRPGKIKKVTYEIFVRYTNGTGGLTILGPFENDVSCDCHSVKLHVDEV